MLHSRVACARQEKRGQKRPRNPTKQEEAWAGEIATWRRQLKVKASAMPFDLLKKPLRGYEPTPRERAILNCVVLEEMARKGVDLNKPVSKARVRECIATTMVDLSRSPQGKSFAGRDGTNGTLTTGVKAVHLGERRRVSGRELLYMQGHPRTMAVPFDTEDSSLRSLAGEGMALPCAAVCILAAYALKNLPSGD